MLKTLFFSQNMFKSFQFYVTYFEKTQQINQSSSSSISVLKQAQKRKNLMGVYIILYISFFFIQTKIPPKINIILCNFIFIENLEPYFNICWASIIFISWFSSDILYSKNNYGSTTLLLYQVLIQERNDFFIWPYHQFNGKTIASHVICKAIEARNMYHMLTISNGKP